MALTYYVNLSDNSNSGSLGTPIDPFGWVEFYNTILSPHAQDVTLKCKGYRNNGPLDFEVRKIGPGQINIEEWDSSLYGPWCIRAVGIYLIQLNKIQGGVLFSDSTTNIYGKINQFPSSSSSSETVLQDSCSLYNMYISSEGDIIFNGGELDVLGSTILYKEDIVFSEEFRYLNESSFKDCVLDYIGSPQYPSSSSTSSPTGSFTSLSFQNCITYFDQIISPAVTYIGVNETGWSDGIIWPTWNDFVANNKRSLSYVTASRSFSIEGSGSYTGYSTGLWGETRYGIGSFWFNTINYIFVDINASYVETGNTGSSTDPLNYDEFSSSIGNANDYDFFRIRGVRDITGDPNPDVNIGITKNLIVDISEWDLQTYGPWRIRARNIEISRLSVHGGISYATNDINIYGTTEQQESSSSSSGETSYAVHLRNVFIRAQHQLTIHEGIKQFGACTLISGLEIMFTGNTYTPENIYLSSYIEDYFKPYGTPEAWWDSSFKSVWAFVVSGSYYIATGPSVFVPLTPPSETISGAFDIQLCQKFPITLSGNISHKIKLVQNNTSTTIIRLDWSWNNLELIWNSGNEFASPTYTYASDAKGSWRIMRGYQLNGSGVPVQNPIGQENDIRCYYLRSGDVSWNVFTHIETYAGDFDIQIEGADSPGFCGFSMQADSGFPYHYETGATSINGFIDCIIDAQDPGLYSSSSKFSPLPWIFTEIVINSCVLSTVQWSGSGISYIGSNQFSWVQPNSWPEWSEVASNNSEAFSYLLWGSNITIPGTLDWSDYPTGLWGEDRYGVAALYFEILPSSSSPIPPMPSSSSSSSSSVTPGPSSSAGPQTITLYVDLDLVTGGHAGTFYDPLNYADFITHITTVARTQDDFTYKIKGDYSAASIDLQSTFNQEPIITLEAWDSNVYGPWRLSSTADLTVGDNFGNMSGNTLTIRDAIIHSENDIILQSSKDILLFNVWLDADQGSGSVKHIQEVTSYHFGTTVIAKDVQSYNFLTAVQNITIFDSVLDITQFLATGNVILNNVATTAASKVAIGAGATSITDTSTQYGWVVPRAWAFWDDVQDEYKFTEYESGITVSGTGTWTLYPTGLWGYSRYQIGAFYFNLPTPPSSGPVPPFPSSSSGTLFEGGTGLIRIKGRDSNGVVIANVGELNRLPVS